MIVSCPYFWSLGPRILKVSISVDGFTSLLNIPGSRLISSFGFHGSVGCSRLASMFYYILLICKQPTWSNYMLQVASLVARKQKFKVDHITTFITSRFPVRSYPQSAYVGATTFRKTKHFNKKFSSFGDVVQSAQSDAIWSQFMYNINLTVVLSGYQGPQINFHFTAFHYAFWASIPFQRGHPQ